MPKSVVIRAIGVRSKVVKLGTKKIRRMELPRRVPVGWDARSAKPGRKTGVAIIVGSVRRSEIRPGVFKNVSKLDSGDKISIRRSDGRKAVYRVTGTVTYRLGQFPAKYVYAQTKQPLLRIITAGGGPNPRKSRGYVVVTSRLVAAR